VLLLESILLADHVLEQCLNPSNKSSIAKSLFTISVGIVMVSVVEVGFSFSASVGTGIIMKRDTTTGKWSYPVACGLGGLGWGFLIGGSVKDLIIFILDTDTLHAMAFDKAGVKVGSQLEATIGTLGLSTSMDFVVSGKGRGKMVSYAFSKGAFLGISVEGAVIGARHKINQSFYNRGSITSEEIFRGDFDLPTTVSGTKLQDVYAKLDLLTSGAASSSASPGIHNDGKESKESLIDTAIAPALTT
jgi:lipid-binding SYLF domain-containing protein